MLRSMLNIKILVLSFMAVNAAEAMDVGGSVSFDFSKTSYSECQHLADAINDKQELYCSPHATNKEYLLKEIKKQKKKLKKCEKKRSKWYAPISGGQVTFTYKI